MVATQTSVLLISVISLSVNLVSLSGTKKSLIKAIHGFYPNSLNATLSVDDFSEHFNVSIREKQVLQLIIKGKSNKEIEQELIISSHTVKTTFTPFSENWRSESGSVNL